MTVNIPNFTGLNFLGFSLIAFFAGIFLADYTINSNLIIYSVEVNLFCHGGVYGRVRNVWHKVLSADNIVLTMYCITLGKLSRKKFRPQNKRDLVYREYNCPESQLVICDSMMQYVVTLVFPK